MIVVSGATGQLGSAFQRLVSDARFLTRADLDLATAKPDEVQAAIDGADTVINCAAYTAVDRAEEESELADQVNATAVGNLASATADQGVRLVTYSTDYVFRGDGDSPYVESDPTDPINTYGATKLRGEELALANDPGALVIRTSWVLSPTHRNFVSAIVGKARNGPLQVVSDQTGCPTMVDDLARGTLKALDRDVNGLLHLTNTGETTWYSLAREAVSLAGLDPELVSPCATEDYPTPAARPSYSVLGSSVRDDAGIRPLPAWQESLPAIVDGLVDRVV